MRKGLSFIEDDFELILNYSNSLLPGMLKVIAIYYDEKNKSLLSRVQDNPSRNTKIRNYSIVDSRDIVLKLRSENMEYNWYKRSELPFDTPDEDHSQKDIFSEVDNTVLLLKFKNENDGLYDLLFLYFKSNLSNFKISRNDKALSSDNKSIIAGLIYNFLQFTFNQNRNNRSIFKSLNNNTHSLINEAESLKNELKVTRHNYSESLANLCQQYLKEYSQSDEKEYFFTEEAVNKIKSFKGNINHLRTIIENAILYASSLNFAGNGEKITINEWHINTDNYSSSGEENKNYTVDSKYVKTINLLDRYENAAQLLQSNNEAMTGVKLGKACKEPISAPAITDSLKKHKNKILYLFDKYPQKWEVIRNEFRPVINIVTAR
ncbi:hypothetical protein ACFLRY_04600 [Bacteroidota bacterium]